HEKIIAIEEIEEQRNPLLGRVIPATVPLELTADQQVALEQIVGKQGRGQRDNERAPTRWRKDDGREQGDTRTGQAPSLHDMNHETSHYSRGDPLWSPEGGVRDAGRGQSPPLHYANHETSQYRRGAP